MVVFALQKRRVLEERGPVQYLFYCETEDPSEHLHKKIFKRANHFVIQDCICFLSSIMMVDGDACSATIDSRMVGNWGLRAPRREFVRVVAARDPLFRPVDDDGFGRFY